MQDQIVRGIIEPEDFYRNYCTKVNFFAYIREFYEKENPALGEEMITKLEQSDLNLYVFDSLPTQ